VWNNVVLKIGRLDTGWSDLGWVLHFVGRWEFMLRGNRPGCGLRLPATLLEIAEPFVLEGLCREVERASWGRGGIIFFEGGGFYGEPSALPIIFFVWLTSKL
jgi:hypothetical protein